MRSAVALVFAAAGSAFASPISTREDPKECIISAGSTHHITFLCDGTYYNATDESETFKERGDLEKVLIDCQDQQVYIKGRPEESDVEDESTEWFDQLTRSNVWVDFNEIFGFNRGYVTGYMCNIPPKGPI